MNDFAVGYKRYKASPFQDTFVDGISLAKKKNENYKSQHATLLKSCGN